MKGEIKRWVKSYGFIETDEMDEDIFVHESEIDGEPKKGMELEFDAEETRKGFQAKNAKIIGESKETQKKEKEPKLES